MDVCGFQKSFGDLFKSDGPKSVFTKMVEIKGKVTKAYFPSESIQWSGSDFTLAITVRFVLRKQLV